MRTAYVLTVLSVIVAVHGTSPGRPPERMCVAVLEPEVLGDLPSEKRKALAGAVDTLLTEHFSKHEGFVLVDRRALEKVLTEQKALAARDVAEPLRPFWAAGVLLCSQVDAKAGTIMAEAVSAQTGQRIAGVYLNVKVASAADVAKAIEPKCRSFAEAIVRGVASRQDKPLLEISGKLTGGLTRLTWMVDDLTEAVAAKVAAGEKVVPLVPRHPLGTKEERLLRVMGLSQARKGDATAGLSPVPQMRLSFDLTDSAKTGVSFERTPISLTLSLRRGAGQPIRTRITGQVGLWEPCREKATSWVAAQLAAKAGTAPPAADDDDKRAKQLAAEELAAVSHWAALGPVAKENLGIALRARVARHALRAAHLDPTGERAAYLVAYYVDALYRRDDTGDVTMSFACIDRAIVETQRYLDRFKQQKVEHHRQMLNQLGMLGVKGAWKLSKNGRKDALLREPDVRLYPYASVHVRAWAEEGYLGNVDKRYNTANSFSAFSFNLLSRLIPCIPEAKLDAEHEYWRTFYATKVAKVMKAKRLTDFKNDRPAPWELIDAAFQARKKNPSAVRANLQRLARTVPRNEGYIWGGDQWTPPRIPMLLQAAGDRQWKTWQPQFGAPKVAKVSLQEMTSFMSRLSPSSTGMWDYGSLPTLAGDNLPIPAAVRLAGEKPGNTTSRSVEALAIAGGDLWLMTPGSLPGSSPGDTAEPYYRFFVVPLDARGRTTGKATEITWPETDKLAGQPVIRCHYVTHEEDAWTVWLGTYRHGLARFDKKDGRWVGRWYNGKHGTPSNGVTRMTTCRNNDANELLIIDDNSRRQYSGGRMEYGGPKLMVWSLNPSSGQVTLVHNGAKDNDAIHYPTVELADGRRMVLHLAGEGAYDRPPQIGEFRRIVTGKVLSTTENRAPFTIAQDGTRRLWALEGNLIQGYDPVALTPIKECPRKGSSKPVSVAVSRQVRFVLGTISAWSGSARAVTAPSWPTTGWVVFATGRGDTIWMAITTGARSWDHCRYLLGYRPAPPGSKNWAAEDAWIGPLATPDGELIYGLQPHGQKQILLSTHNHVMRLNSDNLVAAARKAGHVRSTVQWRQEFQSRAGKGSWQAVMPLMICNGQYEKARLLLDKRTAALGAKAAGGEEALRLLLWRARLLAEQKDRLNESVRLYDQAAGHPKAGLAGEAFARANQIVMLHRAKRWQEMLDLSERVQRRFPQMRDSDARLGMGWYIADARKKLAAKTKRSAKEARP